MTKAVVATRAELRVINEELTAMRAKVAAAGAELDNSSEERQLLRETFMHLLTLLLAKNAQQTPRNMKQFPVVDGAGQQVSIVSIEQVSGEEEEQRDYEETEE